MRSAILFDIDGTLVDSTYHHALAWQRAFTRVGVTVPASRVHRAIGMGGDRLVAHVAGDAVEDSHGDTVRAGWEEEYERLVGEVTPLPGTADLLRALDADGHAILLASSGKSRFSRAAVDTLGVADVVTVATSSDDAESSKPDPDILASALERLSPRADRAVVVGDTPFDVEAATRIGLRCVGVLTGGFSTAELTEAGAALVVADLGELSAGQLATHLAAPRHREPQA